MEKTKENKKLWAIHSWVGLYAGVIIAFLSITGAAALFKTELDHLLNPHLKTTVPKGSKVAMTPVIEKVKALHPDKVLFEVEMPGSEKGTWNIRLMPHKQERLFPVLWEVFVNPYSGEILGERNYYKTFQYYLRNIHVRFYEGFFGRQIVGLAGIALLISTVTGFLIYGQFMKKQFFGVIRKKNLRVSQADYHKMIGMLALVFNLMIAITGAWLGLQAYLQKWLNIERPNTFEIVEKPYSKEEDIAIKLDFDSVYHASRTHFPQLIPKLIRPSTNGDGVVELLGDVPRQVYERNSNRLLLSKNDYQPVFIYNISHDNAGAKLFYVQESLHFGDYGGLALKLLYCVLSLTSGFLAISGFVVYLERTKKKRATRPGFTELRPMLVRWTVGMIGACIFIAILSFIWGVGIPTLVVVVSFYGFILLILVKAIFGLIKRKMSNLKNQTT